MEFQCVHMYISMLRYKCVHGEFNFKRLMENVNTDVTFSSG